MKPQITPTPAALRWRAAVDRVIVIQRAERQLRQQPAPCLPRRGLHDDDVYTASSRGPSKSEELSTEASFDNLRTAVANALEARDVLGDDPDQVIPGVREYLFPEPIDPIKGLSSLQGLLFGPRGLLQGLKEMFVERRLGRGFAKALASVVFMPFQLVTVIVDTPRFLGDHLVARGKKQVIQSIRYEGTKQALHSMLGGAIQLAGGLMRLAIPAAIITLGILSAGWAGVLGAAIFEAVYLGEDLAKLGTGEYEEMLLFRALRDVVSGIATIFGAEFIRNLKNDVIEPYLKDIPALPSACTQSSELDDTENGNNP
jgi:hypothetical protein